MNKAKVLDNFKENLTNVDYQEKYLLIELARSIYTKSEESRWSVERIINMCYLDG